jgi:hypothetical protein
MVERSGEPEMSDLASEMQAVLNALEAPVERAAPVAPPPRRRVVEEPVRAPAAEPRADEENHELTAAEESGPGVGVETPPSEGGVGGGKLAVAPVEPRARKRGRPARASGPARGSTAALPAEIVETLRLHRMAEAAKGRRFVLNEWVMEAICNLPGSVAALSRLIDEHYDALNIGVVARDPGWKPTAALPLRVSAAADLVLDTARYELYRRDGTRIDRQDLIGVAILVRLTQESPGTGG